MDFCTAHFGKQLRDLEYQDVVNFFSEARAETDQLEFKSYGGTLNNETYKLINRSINGFLNSSGGLLVWGAPQGEISQEGDEKVFVGELTTIDTVLEKDRLVSRCSDPHTPLPQGIRVQIIPDGLGNCVCIFEIDESNYSPHQFDNRYYMRNDGKTNPAPQHYVEALFRKIRYPNFEAYLNIERCNYATRLPRHIIELRIRLYFFNWSALQNIEYPTMSLMASGGATFDISNSSIVNHTFLERTIHFGAPVTFYYDLVVPRPQPGVPNDIDIVISFGARNTPAKISEYTLTVENLPPTNLDDLISAARLNRLLKDVQEENGTTRESTLESLRIIADDF